MSAINAFKILIININIYNLSISLFSIIKRNLIYLRSRAIYLRVEEYII